MKTLLCKENQPSKYNKMNRRILSLLLLCILFSSVPVKAEYLTVDPGLITATVDQTLALKSIHKKREAARLSTIGAQSAISGGLLTLNKLQSETLNYMKEGSKLLRDLNQVKNIGMDAWNIVSEAQKLVTDIPDNLKGTAIEVACWNKIPQITTDCLELASIINQLVSDTKYTFLTKKTKENQEKKDGENQTSELEQPDTSNPESFSTDTSKTTEDKDDGKQSKKVVNLLNSAERYMLLNTVQEKLESMRFDIRMMRYYIKAHEWTDIWKSFDFDSYAKLIRGSYLMDDIIRDWKKLTK